jgi:hypothetical protein
MKSMRDLINLTEGTIVGRTLEDTLNAVDDQSQEFSNPVVSVPQVGNTMNQTAEATMSAEEFMPNVGFEESAPGNGVDDAVVQQAVARVKEMMDSYVSPMKATDTLIDELTGQGYDDDTITQIVDAVEQFISSNDSSEEADYCFACNGSGEGQYDGSSCSTCGGSGSEPAQHDPDDFTDPEPVDYDQDDDIYEDTIGLNNGYDETHTVDGNDFFPNGADSPVTSVAGPSGARQGDNPEQKKMQVSEVHKELVYGYRSFLKESKNDAHEANLDAAQKELNSRSAEGEDMSGHVVDQKTYKIVRKPSKK